MLHGTRPAACSCYVLGVTINRLIALAHELRVTCRRCGHDRKADLQALVARGFGDREPAALPWKCRAVVPERDGSGSHLCGSRTVGFIITPTRTHT
jgi:hypothetical protein